MTELLKAAIASGQVSAAQIEAHHDAGELPIVMFEPRFQHTYCSQCGRDCGPGDDGVSGCAGHAAIAQPVQPEPTLRETIDGATDENMHVWCKVSDVRAALADAERYRWLKTRLLCADFNYGDPSESCCALVFEIDDDMRVRADLDFTIDAAIKATS